MYYPPYTQPLNNYNNAYNNPLNYPYTQQQQPKQEVIKVHGEEGARAFMLAPSSSALLLDEKDPIIFLVQTDGAGYKTINAYTIAPMLKEEAKEAPLYDQKFISLENRIIELEKKMNESYTAGNERNETSKSNSKLSKTN